MKKQITIPLIIIIVVVLIIGAGIFWYYQNQDDITSFDSSTSGKIAAILAYQQGLVEVKSGASDWQTVETDTVLHQGDSIKTGADSKAIIELENGDIFRLGYETEVFLTSLKSDTVTVSQLAGASYHRVVKDTSKLYKVKADDITVQSMGTAFDVVVTDETVDVACIENKIKVLTEDEETEVAEGSSASVDKTEKNVDVSDIDESDLKNSWYVWNKEEDSKNTDELGIMKDLAGPTVTITSPSDGTTVAENKVTVTGTVDDFEAKLTINDHEIKNEAGQFSKEVELAVGKNIITVVASDVNNNRTIKEIKVIYQLLVAAIPLELTGETKADGVHLGWNASQVTGFQYYKIVRSEVQAEIVDPGEGYLAKLKLGEKSYTDKDVAADKTYYYRVCEVAGDGQMFCSNTINMKGKSEEPVNTNIEPEPEPTAGSGITLTATAQNDGIYLSWTVTDLTIEKGFKIAKGEATNPVYPGNDYKYLSDSAKRSYTWALTDGNTYHFRVCQYNGDGQCLVYSNDVSVTAKKLTSEDVGLSMSAKAEATGVGLWWTDASSVVGFKYYKVVRSETNADLKYPDDSYIAAKSKGEESHRDFSAINGKTYYYRICAVGDNVYCSNVVQVTAINDNTPPTAVTLSATYSAGSLSLSWTQSTEADFKYYKVVWSQTDATPVYPTDGYIQVVSVASAVTTTDDGSAAGSRKEAADLSVGTHYYSVCVVDQANQVACSNTATLTDGVVQ